MKIRCGHIPSDVLYIHGSEFPCTWRWDWTEQQKDELQTVMATPIYCAEIDDKKSIQIGKTWASGRGDVQVKSIENIPVEGYRVAGLELRPGGFRACMVASPTGYFFEIREDILMEAMLTTGVSKGGVLNGKFLWAKVGPELKLIREGSELYKHLLESGSRVMRSVIPKKELKVGTVYENKDGEYGLLLGFADSEEWSLKWLDNDSWGMRHMIRVNKIASDLPRVKKSTLKHYMLWFMLPISQSVDKTTKQWASRLNKALAEKELSVEFVLASNHTMINEVVSSVPIDSNVIELIRIKSIESSITEIERVKMIHFSTVRSHGPYHYIFPVEEATAKALKMALIRPSGSEAPQLEHLMWKRVLFYVNRHLPFSKKSP